MRVCADAERMVLEFWTLTGLLVCQYFLDARHRPALRAIPYAMRLDLSGTLLESLTGKRQSSSRERSR